MLPNFVIFAILINFSKTISGIFIDFSQVVMLTFVNAFASTGSSNFAIVLGLGDLTKLDQGKMAHTVQNGGATSNLLGLVGSAIFAVLMVLISFFVILILTIYLAWRIINLWILIILSPLAYLLYIIPQGKKF